MGVLGESYQDRLIRIAGELNVIHKGQFTLSSGDESDYYVDMRRLMMHAEALHAAASLMLSKAGLFRVNIIGGAASSSIPLIGAMLALAPSRLGVELMQGFYHRDSRSHGLLQVVEGAELSGQRVMLVDDVCTSGNTLLKVTKAVEDAGGVVACIQTVFDRNEGGGLLLHNLNYNYYSFMSLSRDGYFVPYDPPWDD